MIILTVVFRLIGSLVIAGEISFKLSYVQTSWIVKYVMHHDSPARQPRLLLLARFFLSKRTSSGADS